MEISGFELYLLLKLDDVVSLLATFGIIVGIVGGIILAFAPMIISDFSTNEEHHYAMYKKGVKAYFIIVPALLLTATLLPTTKQMATIYVLPPIINNEQVQQIPQDLLDILGLGLDKAKEALKKE